MIYLAIGLAVVFAFVCLIAWALCAMAKAGDEEGGDTIEFDPLRPDEDMLPTWDEICQLPEV